jgi:hypothetical protein
VNEAWFSALGEPLGDGEKDELAAYPQGLGLNPAIAERERLERSTKLDPADRDWLDLKSMLHAAAAAAAGRAGSEDAALRKYALYSGGRWPLGVYHGAFALF